MLLTAPGLMRLQLLPELLQGYDTVTQITALADWLRVQPAPRPRRGPASAGSVGV